MAAITVDGDLLIRGSLIVLGDKITFPASAVLSGPTDFFGREMIAKDSLAVHHIPFSDMRVHDDFSSTLPGVANGNDMAITDSNWAGSGLSLIMISSLADSSVETDYAAFLFAVPSNYVAGGSATLRIRAKLSSWPSESSYIDADIFKWNMDGTIGSNLVSGDTQIPQTSVTDHDFHINSSNLKRGDVLACRIKSALDDSGGASASTLSIYSVKMLLDVKG